MRTYGRVPLDKNGNPNDQLAYTDQYGRYQWVVVETDARGYDDYVYATALVQVLQGNLGESPFYANFGIPAQASVHTQVPPDYAMAFTQSYFAQFFPSVIISRQAEGAYANPIAPTYNVSVMRKDGSTFQRYVAR